MATERDIKKRIRSVSNIAQITKAMEVVSMTKMRRSQSIALSGRPYAAHALMMLKNILAMTAHKHLPGLLTERPVTTELIVIITADKGLVGGFNDAVLRLATHRIKELKDLSLGYTIIAIGRKAVEYGERNKLNITQSFTNQGDITSLPETNHITNLILKGYDHKQWDRVFIAYTHFKSTLSQHSYIKQLLPTSFDSLDAYIGEIIPESGRWSVQADNPINPQKNQDVYNYTYLYDPDPKILLPGLTRNLIRTVIYHVMMESNASEHSARMITMKNASDNAKDLKETLTISFNKIRQADITAEINEIIAGAEALQ